MATQIKIKLQGTNHFVTGTCISKSERLLKAQKSIFSKWQIFKLRTGEYIIAEKLAKGYVVLLKDSVQPPLGKGVHELFDGRKLVMLDGGIIANVVEKNRYR